MSTVDSSLRRASTPLVPFPWSHRGEAEFLASRSFHSTSGPKPRIRRVISSKLGLPRLRNSPSASHEWEAARTVARGRHHKDGFRRALPSARLSANDKRLLQPYRTQLIVSEPSARLAPQGVDSKPSEEGFSRKPQATLSSALPSLPHDKHAGRSSLTTEAARNKREKRTLKLRRAAELPW